MVEIFDRVNKFLVVVNHPTTENYLLLSFCLVINLINRISTVHKQNKCVQYTLCSKVCDYYFMLDYLANFSSVRNKILSCPVFGFNRFPLIFWVTKNVYFYFKRFAIPNFWTELVYAHDYTLFDAVYRFLDKNLLFLPTNFFNLKVM